MPQGYLESNEDDPELIVFIPWVSNFLCSMDWVASVLLFFSWKK